MMGKRQGRPEHRSVLTLLAAVVEKVVVFRLRPGRAFRARVAR